MTASAPALAVERPGIVATNGVETRWLRVLQTEQRVLTAGAPAAAHGPLVLVHGIAGSADEWLGVMPGFAGAYRVVAPDALGHGFSEKPAGLGYSVPGYAASVLGVMDALGIERAPLVAISGGGTVALHMALEHPERISRLVLVDAAGLGWGVSASYRLATLPLARQVFRRANTRARIEAFGRALLYHKDRLPEGWVDRRLQIWATEGAVDAFFATVRMGLTPLGQRVRYTPRLGEIRQPTLLVWGRQDPIIPVRHGVAAARALPRAALHVFEQCGHMPIWEYPDEFVRVVRRFLEDEEAP